MVSAIVGVALSWGSIYLLRTAGGRGSRVALTILGWGSVALGLTAAFAGVVDGDPVFVDAAIIVFGAIGFLLLRRVARLKPQPAPAPPIPVPPSGLPSTNDER